MFGAKSKIHPLNRAVFQEAYCVLDVLQWPLKAFVAFSCKLAHGMQVALSKAFEFYSRTLIVQHTTC